jgi:hypothetical protein
VYGPKEIKKLERAKKGFFSAWQDIQQDEDPAFDLVNALDVYLARTPDSARDSKIQISSSVEETHSRLFVSNQRETESGLFVSLAMDTVRSDIKRVLQEFGFSGCTPHDIRSVAPSMAVASGVNVDEVVSRARWSNPSTFIKFYYRKFGRRPSDKAVSIAQAVRNTVSSGLSIAQEE